MRLFVCLLHLTRSISAESLHGGLVNSIQREPGDLISDFDGNSFIRFISARDVPLELLIELRQVLDFKWDTSQTGAIGERLSV